MAIYSMMFMGMAPFGALLAGLIAERLGAPLTVAIGGVACIAASAVFGMALPRIRAEARAVVIALQASGGQPIEEVANARGDAVPRDAIAGAASRTGPMTAGFLSSRSTDQRHRAWTSS